MVEGVYLPQPLPLLIAHAPRRAREWQALCWRIDDLMARTVIGAREGVVAAIRLAWWEEALTEETGAPVGEPLLQRWWALGPDAMERAGVAAVAEGWRMLLDPRPMSERDWREFGRKRGALFPLIARAEAGEGMARAAAVWALWDMARRDPDRQRAEGAFAAAIEAAETLADLPARPKPLRLASGMALDDIRERRMPDGRFTPRQYLRLLRRAVLG